MPIYYTPDQLIQFYEADGLFAKCVDMPAEDAAGAGFKLEKISKAAAEYYQDQLENLKWEDVAETALRWQRLFGGALIVVKTDGGGSTETPLRLQTVRRVCGLSVFDSAHVLPTISRDGKPENYRISTGGSSLVVHPSHCLLFRSSPLPEKVEDPVIGFWGALMYGRIEAALKAVHVAHSTPLKILNRFQSVYRMRGLSWMMSTEQGQRNLLDRMEVFDVCRGLFSAAIIGEGDEYKMLSAPGTLSEAVALVNQTWGMLSASSGIPQTLLVGNPVPDSGEKIRAPLKKGRDESAFEVYASFIRSIQVQQLKKPILRLLEIIGQAGVNAGALTAPERAMIRFNPVFPGPLVEAVQRDLKEANLELARAQTIQQYIDSGIITHEEARSFFQKDGD